MIRQRIGGHGKLSRNPYCCTLLLYAPSELSPLGAFCLVELRGLEPLTPCLQRSLTGLPDLAVCLTDVLGLSSLRW